MATASRSRLGRRHKPCPVCGKRHSPWWNSSKGRWFLSVETERKGKFRQVNLGPDHDVAIERWHRIEAGLEPVETNIGPTTTSDGILIGELVNLYLDSPAARPSEGRYKKVRHYLGEFAKKFGALPVAALRVGGVNRIETWLDSRKRWCGCRADVVALIRRLFNWSVGEGFIPSSPVMGLKKPKYNVRISTFSQEQVEAILAESNDFFARGFRMLLLTGCRPDEICSLTAENVKEDASGFYLLVKHKNQKHTGKPRRVFLVPEAQQIIREQLKKYPTGRLFRSAAKTSDGVRPPLSVEYFSKALRKLCEKPRCVALDLDEYEVVGGKRLYKYVAYTCRHTFAVRYLTGFYKDAAGEPIELSYEIVAELLGNTAAMVQKVYGHLCDQTKFLTKKLLGLK